MRSKRSEIAQRVAVDPSLICPPFFFATPSSMTSQSESLYVFVCAGSGSFNSLEMVSIWQLLALSARRRDELCTSFLFSKECITDYSLLHGQKNDSLRIQPLGEERLRPGGGVNGLGKARSE